MSDWVHASRARLDRTVALPCRNYVGVARPRISAPRASRRLLLTTDWPSQLCSRPFFYACTLSFGRLYSSERLGCHPTSMILFNAAYACSYLPRRQLLPTGCRRPRAQAASNVDHIPRCVPASTSQCDSFLHPTGRRVPIPRALASFRRRSYIASRCALAPTQVR